MISDLHLSNVGLVSAIGTETRYDVDGSGIEYRWGRDFSHPPTPSLGPAQPPTQWISGHSQG
jgi:hypothetical protein